MAKIIAIPNRLDGLSNPQVRVFESISDCAKALNLSYVEVLNALSVGYPAGGYYFDEEL